MSRRILYITKTVAGAGENSGTVSAVETISQTDYDALEEPGETTLYIITGA